MRSFARKVFGPQRISWVRSLSARVRSKFGVLLAPVVNEKVIVVGAGLAGCELSVQLARRGIPVELWEMKPHQRTPAQRSDGMAELVCSNSLRSNNPENAVGLLKAELRALKSPILAAAEVTRVPAGDALAVDRE